MKEKVFSKSWLKAHAGDLLSYGGLVLCLIVFSFLSEGRLWSAYNIRILIQAVCVYAILSLGAVFIYSMGYMDISVGAQVGVYCILCSKRSSCVSYDISQTPTTWITSGIRARFLYKA